MVTRKLPSEPASVESGGSVESRFVTVTRDFGVAAPLCPWTVKLPAATDVMNPGLNLLASSAGGSGMGVAPRGPEQAANSRTAASQALFEQCVECAGHLKSRDT